MLAPQLLLKTLEGLRKDDFETFKWYLTMEVLEGCSPIPVCHLEEASRTNTVKRMTENYGEDSAVKITIEILKKLGNNNAAEELKKKYAASPAAPVAPPAAPVAPPAAPATISAQSGSVIIAPTITGSTAGTWNVNVTR
ncbi:pyrin-like [Plectropomus leopardus]|uniref:pyrin-like n=1 Tax=Plectropomus leopardus TaxID=160734 RepID=UPI001C4B2158|nr:pyrin-like [Plectropomus leopardus]